MLIHRREFLALASASATLTFGTKAASSSGFTLLRAPYLQGVLADRASILWTTREPGTGTVSISTAGQIRTVTASQTVFTSADTRLGYTFYQYQADFVGLTPGTPYSYSVGVNGQILASDAAQFRFRTADLSGKFSFLAFGDSGEDTPEQQTLIQLMQAEPNIAMAVHTGDLSYPMGDYTEYEDSYFGKNTGLMRQLCFFPVPGNHDNVYNLVPYLSVHAPPKTTVPAGDEGHYYSFDWGNIHFATLDSNLLGGPRSDQMLDWLDQDLKGTQKYWRIVVYHHASYPTGHHIADPICQFARQQVNPIMEKHGVQLVISGHEHGYERTLPLAADTEVAAGQGTTYLITGGGGADLHDVSDQPQTAISLSTYHYTRIDIDGGTLTLRAVGLDGATFDRLVLQPSPILTGVSSAADFTSSISSGSLISLFGRNLATDTTVGSSYPLPAQLQGTSVLIGGESAPLLFVSPSQINCQIPFDITGSEQIRVTCANGSDTTKTTVDLVAPAILTVTYKDKVVSAAVPVPAGSVVVAYMTGLGQVAGGVVAGQAGTSAANVVLTSVSISVGSNPAVALYAGLAPGFAGLYQVNFAVPLGCKSGNNALQIGTTGVNSRNFALPVA